MPQDLLKKSIQYVQQRRWDTHSHPVGRAALPGPEFELWAAPSSACLAFLLTLKLGRAFWGFVEWILCSLRRRKSWAEFSFCLLSKFASGQATAHQSPFNKSLFCTNIVKVASLTTGLEGLEFGMPLTPLAFFSVVLCSLCFLCCIPFPL